MERAELFTTLIVPAGFTLRTADVAVVATFTTFTGAACAALLVARVADAVAPSDVFTLFDAACVAFVAEVAAEEAWAGFVRTALVLFCN